MQVLEFQNRIKVLFKKIVAMVLVCSVSAYVLYGNIEPTMAYEIESLPSEIEIKVDSNSDYVCFEYDGKYYQIDRSFSTTDDDGFKYAVPHYRGVMCFLKLKYTDLGYSNTNYLSSIAQNPISLEKNAGGQTLNCSYWFSPSEMKVYVLTHSRCYSDGDMSYILGYNSGKFLIQGNRTVVITTTVIDLSDTDINYSDLKHGMMDVYADVDKGKFSHSGFYLNNFSFSTISGINSGFNPNTSQYYASYSLSDATYYSYPADMVCIDSNYVISGFYEPTTDNIRTPNYYFKYQYLFYLKDSGFTFIDSSTPLKDIAFPNDDYFAKYIFDSVGNLRIYQSVNGTSWDEKTTVTTMYTDTFSINYPVLCKGQYKLIWSNDSDYDSDPLVPPEYGSITDITSDLDSLLDDFDRIELPDGIYDNNGIVKDIIALCVENSSGTEITRFLSSSLTYDSVYYVTYRARFGVGFRHLYIFGSDIPPEYCEELVNEFNISINWHIGTNITLTDTDYIYFDLVESSVVEIPTLAMYNKLMSNSLNNFDKQLGALRFDLHSDLQSIFDNVSFIGLYMQKLITSVGDVESAVVGVGNRLLTTNGFLDGISDKLDTIISKIGGSVGSSLVELDNSLDIDWLLADDEDGFNNDYGYLLNSLSTNSVIKYFDNSLNKIKDLTDFSDTFSFVNGFVDSIVSNMGVYSAVVFLPPALAITNLVLRKERL